MCDLLNDAQAVWKAKGTLPVRWRHVAAPSLPEEVPAAFRDKATGGLLGVGIGRDLLGCVDTLIEGPLADATGLDPAGVWRKPWQRAWAKLLRGGWARRPAYIWASGTTYSAAMRRWSTRLPFDNSLQKVVRLADEASEAKGVDRPGISIALALDFLSEREARLCRTEPDSTEVLIETDAFADPNSGTLRMPIARRVLGFEPKGGSALGFSALHSTIGRCDLSSLEHILQAGFFPNHKDSLVRFRNGDPILSPHAILMAGRVEPAAHRGGFPAEMRTLMCVIDQGKKGGMFDTMSAVRSRLDYQLLIRPDMAAAFEDWFAEVSEIESPGTRGSKTVARGGLHVPSLSEEQQRKDEEGVRTGRPEDEITQEDESIGASSESLRGDFAAEAKPDIAELVAMRADELIPAISNDEIRWWEERIADAQRYPPEDKHLFVDSVNRILDTFDLRMDIGDGELYRLVAKPGRRGKGLIQFSGGRKRTQGGFKVSSVRLVGVPKNYIGNQHRLKATTS